MSAFRETMSLNLSSCDKKSFRCLARSFDLINFSIFWSGGKMERALGEVTQDNVEQLLVKRQWDDGTDMEPFLQDYLNTYKTNEERIENYSFLIRDFLHFYRLNATNAFLREYFSFKQDLRVIMAGFRAKLLNEDISRVLRNENTDEFTVLQILMQKNSSKFIPPLGYRDLGDIFEDYGQLPDSLHREMVLYEFNKIEELFRDSYFNSDAVLGRSAAYMTAYCYHFSSRKNSKRILNDIEIMI